MSKEVKCILDVKAYLSRYLYLCDEIDRKIEEVLHLRERAERITSEITRERIQASKQKDGLERSVIQIITLEESISSEIDNLINTKKEIQDAIETVEDDRYKMLLRYRYLSGLTWEEIAQKMNYTYRNVCYLHGKALQKIILS